MLTSALVISVLINTLYAGLAYGLCRRIRLNDDDASTRDTEIYKLLSGRIDVLETALAYKRRPTSDPAKPAPPKHRNWSQVRDEAERQDVEV